MHEQNAKSDKRTRIRFSRKVIGESGLWWVDQCLCEIMWDGGLRVTRRLQVGCREIRTRGKDDCGNRYLMMQQQSPTMPQNIIANPSPGSLTAVRVGNPIAVTSLLDNGAQDHSLVDLFDLIRPNLAHTWPLSLLKINPLSICLCSSSNHRS
ncbi:hypothetical protein PILCRDRAFT_493212 [Piloderma croceum F 1598]|uniref:Uncharacterized protein n=1 Tax=Piloderma croceum (strain F 1598) TaxID=765440 RepID=A0A0C3FRV5_PILCF|nr:hypothetical protein PILCRDRAFT_493212 [Piloderma croceum F 1598]